MPRTRSGWKQYERAVARKVHARRIPVTGRQGPLGDPGDIDVPGFYTEVRTRLRARPLRWMQEIHPEARRRGLKPMLVFQGPAPALSPLVILRWADFAEVFNRAERTGPTGPDAGSPRPAAPRAEGAAGAAPGAQPGGPADAAAGLPRPGQGDRPGG